MKIAIFDSDVVNRLEDLNFDDFYQFGDVTVYPKLSKFEIKDACSDKDIIMTNKTVINKEIIESSPNLKYIGLFSTGYNVVDITCAKSRNIIVSNVPDYSTNAVAQLTFSLILELYSKVGKYNSLVKSGEWSKSEDFCLFADSIFELEGKTIGILGFGNIGIRVAKIAQSFGMKVVVYSRSLKLKYESESLKFVQLDELFKLSDIVSIHCPLNDETKELVCEDKLKLMKPSSILINTSRGRVIKENDLVRALADRSIRGAGLDVVAVEPIKDDNPLLNLDNCIITPHIAWIPCETRRRLVKIAASNLKAYLEGRAQNVVN